MREKRKESVAFFQEILEQPYIFRKIRNSQGRNINKTAKYLSNCSEIHFTGCGDAYANAVSLSAACFDLTGIRATAHEALEFAYYYRAIKQNSALVIISVKGRSKLAVKALTKARQYGMLTILLTNDPSGPMVSNCEGIIELKCGTWKGPRTKTFSSVLFAGYLLFMKIAQIRGHLLDKNVLWVLNNADKIYQQYVKNISLIEKIVKRISIPEVVTFVAAGPNIGTGLYGAAKVKETNRISSIFYELEEFAHIETVAPSPKNLTIFLDIGPKTRARFFELIQVSMNVLQRDVIVSSDRKEKRNYYFPPLKVPEIISPLFYTLPVQLFAYTLATKRGIDADRMPLRETSHRIAFLPQK